MTARFVLAKFAPDVNRMEPRNIGVFVWQKGHTAWRMLPTSDAGFISDKHTYERWKDYWADLIDRDEIRVPREEPISRHDDKFLDAFCKTEDGNYILMDAGFVTERVSVKELPNVADFLFQKLVVPQKFARKKERRRLSHACDEIFEQSGLAEAVKPRFPVTLAIYGLRRDVRFSYGFGDVEPDSLLQTASIASDESVHDAALKIFTAYQEAIVDKEKCAVFVDAGEGRTLSQRESANLSLLENVCGVIDVSMPEEAIRKVRKIAA